MRRILFTILLVFSGAMLAQEKLDSVGAVVLDAETGEPLPYVSVYVSPTCGTISNYDGEFCLQCLPSDVLRISCIGYEKVSCKASELTATIHMKPLSNLLREVTVMPFSNYETFREMIITMPSIATPGEIARLEDDLNDLWMSRAPAGNGMVTVTANPIQFLYDKYNKTARTQARLLRNRRMYNEVLREQGRTDELLPDSLDYPINYSVFQLDEATETGDKPMVPRKKKYLRLGQ